MLDVLRVIIRPNSVCLVAKKCSSHRPLAGAKILWSSASSHKLATDHKSGHQIPLNFEVESAGYGNGASSAMEQGRYWIAQFGDAGEHAGVERELGSAPEVPQPRRS